MENSECDPNIQEGQQKGTGQLQANLTHVHMLQSHGEPAQGGHNPAPEEKQDPKRHTAWLC
jgi:hypothetical protein